MYHMERLCSIPEYQLEARDKENILLSSDDILKMAEDYYDLNDGEIGGSYNQYDEYTPMEALMKVYFYAKKHDAKIVIDID